VSRTKRPTHRNGHCSNRAITEIVSYFSHVLSRLELKSDFFNSLFTFDFEPQGIKFLLTVDPLEPRSNIVYVLRPPVEILKPLPDLRLSLDLLPDRRLLNRCLLNCANPHRH
jgi:hypothetical protein